MEAQKQFEAWTANEGGNLTRHPDNQDRYMSATVQGRWLAFQEGWRRAIDGDVCYANKAVSKTPLPTHALRGPDGEVVKTALTPNV